MPSTAPQNDSPTDTLQGVAQLRQAREDILREVRKVIIGQQDVIDDVLTCLFSRGHALIVGVPGLAKTLLVSTIGCMASRLPSSVARPKELTPA